MVERSRSSQAWLLITTMLATISRLIAVHLSNLTSFSVVNQARATIAEKRMLSWMKWSWANFLRKWYPTGWAPAPSPPALWVICHRIRATVSKEAYLTRTLPSRTVGLRKAYQRAIWPRRSTVYQPSPKIVHNVSQTTFRTWSTKRIQSCPSLKTWRRTSLATSKIN